MSIFFQSTPPVRGATSDEELAEELVILSIHAPREGGDFSKIFDFPLLRAFNPRPP